MVRYGIQYLGVRHTTRLFLILRVRVRASAFPIQACIYYLISQQVKAIRQ